MREAVFRLLVTLDEKNPKERIASLQIPLDAEYLVKRTKPAEAAVGPHDPLERAVRHLLILHRRHSAGERLSRRA